MNRQITTLAFLTLALAAAPACAPDDGEPVDDAQEEGPPLPLAESRHNLIAEVEFDNGGSLRYFEPEEGTLLTIEKGNLKEPRELVPNEDELNPAERYEALTGATAPARLVELAEAAALRDSEEQSALPNLDEVEEQGAPPNRVDVVEKDSSVHNDKTYDEFWNWRCASADFRRELWTMPTHHKRKESRKYKFGVYAHSGPVLVELAVDGIWGDADVDAGWYAAVTIDATGLFRTDNVETKASGGVFTHCVQY